MENIVRLSLSIDKELNKDLERMIRAAKYRNRSEYIRDLLRERMVDDEWESSDEVLATITLVYDHHQRDLCDRLITIQHNHGECIVASTHVHVSHEICAEMIMCKGSPSNIREMFAELRQEKGVVHAAISRTTTGKKIN